MRSIACYRKKFSTVSRCNLDLFISFVIKQPIAKLYSDPDYLLSAQEETQLEKLLARYQQGEPIAYLMGRCGFWEMDLMVTRDTLIPRPETECLVQWIIGHSDKNKIMRVADLGTGTGAIAIALALENPHWKIDAMDLSLAALAVAKHNAKTYQIKNIDFYHGNWCDALPHCQYDFIVANPPYIAENDPHLSQLMFEPRIALVSGTDGLDALRKIISQAKSYLKNTGILVLEHGFEQANQVCLLLQNAKYHHIKSHRDLSGHARFIRACLISRGSSENDDIREEINENLR